MMKFPSVITGLTLIPCDTCHFVLVSVRVFTKAVTDFHLSPLTLSIQINAQ